MLLSKTIEKIERLSLPTEKKKRTEFTLEEYRKCNPIQLKNRRTTNIDISNGLPHFFTRTINYTVSYNRMYQTLITAALQKATVVGFQRTYNIDDDPPVLLSNQGQNPYASC